MVARRKAGFAARLIAAVVMCFGFIMPVAGAQAAATGAVSAITWGQSRADVDREVALLKEIGARYVRANINWASFEADGKGKPEAGALSMYDYAIDTARAAGLEVVMPLSDGVPYWASGDPAKYVDANGGRHWNKTYPPANMADYADAFRAVVARYAPRGVHVFEVWNEPNLGRFWASGPDPAAYARMLQAAYPAIKQADPQSTVLLGGLSKNDFAYLEGVYRAGGGGYFDAVAVHPYTYGVDPTVTWNGVNAGEDRSRLSWNSFPALKEIRRSMDAFGDTGKGVWITEFGYSTTSHDGGVTEARQAEYLTKAFEYVEQFPWVKAMFWYSARNSPWMKDADDYESRFGLVATDWRLKPSATALQAYASTQPAAPTSPASPTAPATPAPPATPTSPSTPTNQTVPTNPTTPSSPTTPASPTPPRANAAPMVRITRPLAAARFSLVLDLAATATDDDRVTRVDFRVDGRTVATDTTAPFALRWRVPTRLARGAHTITAVAYDAAGLRATDTVSATRVSQTSARSAKRATARKRAAHLRALAQRANRPR
jgi:hypothetical protein